MRGVEETDWGYRWCGRLRWPRTLNIRATRARVGEWGERLALRHVRNLGWDVMARNWKTARGELDLIAHDGTQLVVIEVRTRGVTVGYWVPRDEWERMQELARRRGEDGTDSG